MHNSRIYQRWQVIEHICPCSTVTRNPSMKTDAIKRKEDYAIDKPVSLTVKKKFEAVFVTVAMTDEHFCRDLTNIVHITALKTNTRLKQKTLTHTATCKQWVTSLFGLSFAKTKG